jgi:hypothetical protein
MPQLHSLQVRLRARIVDCQSPFPNTGIVVNCSAMPCKNGPKYHVDDDIQARISKQTLSL